MNAAGDAIAPDLSTVRAALSIACRAPSVHNTQPWRWSFDGTWLFLYSDATRQLTEADPQARQLTISCGAALDHARQAFVSMGWFTHVTRLPDPHRPELLAVLEFRPWDGPLNRTAARVRAIPRRHSDRLPMSPPEDWPGFFGTARELARPHHVAIDEIAEADRHRLAAVARHAAALRRNDSAYQDELHWWSGFSGSADGIPASALISAAEAARTTIGRAFPLAPYSNRRPGLDDRARLIVFSTIGDSPGQWLHTGEALSDVLLECTARGLSTGELTDITELASTRSVLAELITQPGAPQIVLRVGVAPEDDTAPSPTPRRPLSEVFDFRLPHPGGAGHRAT